MTDFVFAPAGYLLYDVSEDVTLVLVASLETIDADRIAMLVE